MPSKNITEETRDNGEVIMHYLHALLEIVEDEEQRTPGYTEKCLADVRKRKKTLGRKYQLTIKR